MKTNEIILDTVRWTGNNRGEVSLFVKECYPKVIDRRVRINTRNGHVWVNEGDYIVKNNSDVFVISEDTFKDLFYTEEISVYDILKDYFIRNNIVNAESLSDLCSCNFPSPACSTDCVTCEAKPFSEIIHEFMQKNGFKSLYFEGSECCCSGDFKCGRINMGCTPRKETYAYNM